MIPSGLDLLLRVVAEQLHAQRCERCQTALGQARIVLRERTADRVVAEITCPVCAHAWLLEITPEADGIARVG